jgi:hypothetical protein
VSPAPTVNLDRTSSPSRSRATTLLEALVTRFEDGGRAVDVQPMGPAPVVEPGFDAGLELAADATDGPHDAPPVRRHVRPIDRREVDDLGDAGLRENRVTRMAVSGMYICFVVRAGVTRAKAQQPPRRSSSRDANTLGESNQGSQPVDRPVGGDERRSLEIPDPVHAPQ